MFDWLAHRTRVSPDKLALIFGEQRWTYKELNTLVDRMAGRLAADGVKSGHHVAVLMPNRGEYVCAIYAPARLGTVLVPLNTRLAAGELHRLVEQSGSQFVICTGETTHIASQLSVPFVNLDEQKHFKVIKSETPDTFTFDTVQSIVYTSGTTGTPKGAALTFNNHWRSATASAFRLGTLPEDRWLLCMPLYHVGGMAIVLRCGLYGTTVVLQNGFDPVAVSDALKNDGVTLISVVPTMLHRLLEQHRASLVNSKLRCILVGGAAMPQPLVEQCLELNLPIATTYGLTEAASQVATATPAETRRKPGSVGKPLMFSSVQIVDRVGNPVPIGNIGEIVIKGPTVMQEYFNQRDATEKTIQDGFLHTGDMGYLDKDGDLWIVQRRADLIVSGGENVYPVEVEHVLRGHPAVVDACVVGITDAEWGQRVTAAVIKTQVGVSTRELLEFCRTRLAGYKQPRRLCFVKSLPVTASGKIRRDVVRQQIEAEFNQLKAT